MRFSDLLEFVQAQLPPAPGRVLEVGCGEGRLALAIDGLGHRVTAIDPAAPEGAIFRRVTLEEFSAPERFDAIVASRTLHHIADLRDALSKLRGLLVPGGRLIVIEHAWERLDERTARWYLERRRAAGSGGPGSLPECVETWRNDHAGLHSAADMRRELDLLFSERYFAWTPYLHGELGEALEPEERRLVDSGEIQATGFSYVGERGGRGRA
jgi:SAM-dependent methyltransferase